jgi:transposase
VASEALGRSRGGLTTKIHLCAEGKARPLSLVLSEGQASESKHMEPTLDGIRVPRGGRGRPRKRPGRLNNDKGYSYARCRKALRRRGIKHQIPERSDQIANRKKKGSRGGRPVVFVPAEYADRNVVERCILRLKQWRRVATRYEKRAANYLTMVTLAAIMIWLK